VANLRIISDNAVDRATALVASTTSGSLVASYMQNDFKGKAHRSTGTSVSYAATWTDGESIGGIALPATNLTADATIRVRAYSDTAGVTQIKDTGVQYACAGQDLGLWNWSEPLNANAFAFGGVSKVQVWLGAHYFARRLLIDIVDSGNPAGYIDCARLVAGAYWEAPYNPGYGVLPTVVDTTASHRNDAGDNLSDRGTLHDTLSLDLKMLAETDRAALMRIARLAGTACNIFVSVFPEDDSPVAEQDFCIFGKRANAGVAADFYANFSHKLDLEGW
jgi:hypothetical protein